MLIFVINKSSKNINFIIEQHKSYDTKKRAYIARFFITCYELQFLKENHEVIQYQSDAE